jgi:uncharacterized membrane protein YfcA
VLLLMPASLITARIGARTAHAISRRRLELAFAIYLTVVSAEFCLSMVAM